MSSLNHDDFAHLKIPLEIIRTATNNFAKENIHGDGGFGNHYKGEIMWSGELINISARRLNKERDEEKEQEFWMEIFMLSSLKHKNLVSLVGFCDEDDEKIIVIKRESYGSLVNCLSYSRFLTWVRRLEICVGLAHALSYIHYDEHRAFSVIHRNIDSEIILLNDNWEPKLCEFRLSMKIKASQRHHSFHVDKVLDTEGYTDPIYIETKSVSHKSDIYSFGIVMFELLCGRKSVIVDDANKYLATLAITRYREKTLHEIIDWDLWQQIDSQSFDIFAKTAYECLNEERSQRPNIDEIVTRLEQALELELEHQKAVMSLPRNEFAHLKIPLQNIISATNNFANESGFEKEYNGQLLWSGDLIEITAKRLNKDEWDDEDEQQFWMEVSLLYTLKHKNLISLVGFCYENDEKIIIYRREIRGSLSGYLSDTMMLTWVRRLEICVGIAHALSYIHFDEPRDFSVIHRRINNGTVLLNVDWEPKLSNFEVSMKIKASQRHHSFIAYALKGVSGYVDPTYIETKSVNHKSDMYSFGIVLFELLCGRRSIINNDSNKYLALLYKEKRLDEIIDSNLWKQIDLQSLDVFAETAYACLNEERSRRPNIDDIVTRLEKALDLARVNKHRKSSPKDEFAHLRIPLKYILSATNNFSDNNVIIQTVFSKDYKGQLWCSGELINITARRLNKERYHGEQEFWMEISLLSSLKHKNVVSLVGFCDENDEKVIINRHATRGRLDNYLRDPMLLTWVRRLEISVGIAHALSYIHYDERRDFSVIHRIIDSSNVILNDDWEPKLSSFERSMKIEATQRHHSIHTNTVLHVVGYGDPTSIETKLVNHKSDIYSFGIVLLELLSGRESIIDYANNKYLAPLAITHYREKRLHEIIAWDLLEQIDLQSFNMFAEIAYECLAKEQSGRPNIDDIVPRLEKALELARENRPIMSSPKDKLAHLSIPLESILSATNNFAQDNVTRDAPFAKEYKGQLLLHQNHGLGTGIFFGSTLSSQIARRTHTVFTKYKSQIITFDPCILGRQCRPIL